MRRMAKAAAINLWWLSIMGLMQRSGRMARWMARKVSELEHGLKCLVIIAASSLGRASRANALNPLASLLPAANNTAASSPDARGLERFSLNLRVFAENPGHHSSRPDCADTPEAGETSAVARPASDRHHDLSDRIARLQRLLADPHALVPRMLRQIAREGFTLARALARQPASTWTVLAIACPKAGHTPPPAICDSS